jgi:hypothetical protein
MEEMEAQCPLGPIYGVELIDALEIDGGMRQAMPSASDLKGIRNYRQGQRVVAGYEVLLNSWREQAEEIARLEDLFADSKKRIVVLQDIVDKLPQTADGVPVVPGMKVYAKDPTGYIQGYDVGTNSARTDSSIPEPTYLQYNWHCYSTREAAEAAGKDSNV